MKSAKRDWSSNPRVRDSLVLIQDLRLAGDNRAMAEEYLRLAYTGEARFPKIVPECYLRAGQAFLCAGDSHAAMKAFQSGVEYLYNIVNDEATLDYGKRLVYELRRDGYAAQAQEIAAWIERALEMNGLASQLATQPLDTLASAGHIAGVVDLDHGA